MAPADTRPGDVLAGRYRLTDLLAENAGGRFWRAFDSTLQRDVAVHILAADDARADLVRDAARTAAQVLDRRLLRILDVDETAGRLFVVNEWGSGTSLDILLGDSGPLAPATAAWVVSEASEPLVRAHELGLAHGRLIPENVLIDHNGEVRLIGFGVDAAIHGLPAGRVAGDVSDLGGMLHVCLTGKWAGVSRSAVPSAPTAHGRVLRPRQVRAGIPKPLDTICDHVVNRSGHASAETIGDRLREFLGDDAGAAGASLARIEHARPAYVTVVLPQLADPPVKEQDFASDEEPAPDPVEPTPPDPSDDQPAPEVEQPTQAGLPIFHDETDEVGWLSHHPEKSPPPPPFEPPPERPLFAPERADGTPVRRPRPAPPTPVDQTGGGFWPFQDASGSDEAAHEWVDTGSGVFPAVSADPEAAEAVPGRNWLRLALVIAACLLVLLAAVIAYNLQRGKNVIGQNPGDRGSSSASASPSQPVSSATAPTASLIKGITADDFDPQGQPPEENSATVSRVVDGDLATAWETSSYRQNLGPGGLKTGVGVVLDLGRPVAVDKVGLVMVGSPTQVRIYVTADPPSGVPTGRPAAAASVQGAATSAPPAGSGQQITLDPAATGRYVTVWLTSLPAVPGGFRGEIAEATVTGG